MIEETANVVRAEQDDVWVEVQRQSACGQCAANKGCGTAVLQQVMGNKRTQVRVLSDIPVNVGDAVIVGMEEAAFLKGSFAIYLVPLILMFIFGVLGETLAQQLAISAANATSIVFAGVGFAVGFFWLRWFNRNISRNKNYQPVILSVLRHGQVDQYADLNSSVLGAKS